MGWRSGAARDGTRRCGCRFCKNPPTGKPAGAFLHPHTHPRVSGGFRVPAGVTKDIIKMHKSFNLNSQTLHFYK